MDIKVIIVNVILPLPVKKSFRYLMPDSMLPVVGGRVMVPFHSKIIVGIVISFSRIIDLHILNVKYVQSLIDTKPLYNLTILDFLIWLSAYYHCPIGSVFFSTLPKCLYRGYTVKEKYINKLNKSNKKFDDLVLLKEKSILSSKLKNYNIPENSLNKLEIKKLCNEMYLLKKISDERKQIFVQKKFFLNKRILLAINSILMKKKFSSFLLTKTNLYSKIKFYLELIRKILQTGSQILIIASCIKDISKISFFLKRFFHVCIDVIHSKLTDSMYLNIWIKTKNGGNSIIIGTKKSIFLPFFKLGLIIIDQEHSLNYKMMGKCRYNIRDISILRAFRENIPIILDSDTPSLKTLHNILHKKCFYIKINSFNYIIKFKHNIINLKKEKIQIGLSETLINEIHKNLNKNNQVLLIFRKFNFSFFVLMCHLCKSIFKCSSCNDYYEVNLYENVLCCKYCLIKIQRPLFCFNCKLLSLVVHDMSKKKIIDKMNMIFPKIPLIFLSNKKNISKNISNAKFFDFSISDSCIIIGTEKVIKNYFFSCVTLIALISIDYYLLSFQFRSIEYFAQFYINLRKVIKKTVSSFKILIQTSYPNDIYLKRLCCDGYFSLSNNILLLRKKFLLPPWSYQATIYTESIHSEKSFIFLNLLRQIIIKKSKKYNTVIWCLNPSPCFIFQNKKKFFYQLSIQSCSRSFLNKVLNESIYLIKFFSISKSVMWFIDIDPN